MRNKDVGYLIVGISLLIGLIVLFFNQGMEDIVNETCSHGPECSMYDTIDFQTNLSLIIAGLVFLIGLFLIFSKESEKIVIQKVKEKQKKVKLDLTGLDDIEKKVVSIIERENGAVFQKTLMEELGIGKVKMTRIADKLEAKQIIERKRRGMNNILVLKR